MQKHRQQIAVGIILRKGADIRPSICSSIQTHHALQVMRNQQRLLSPGIETIIAICRKKAMWRLTK
jgi:hypothetical protein